MFTSQREDEAGLFWAAADGSGEAERLIVIDDARVLRPYAWSGDGSMLLFEYGATGADRNIGMLLIEGETTWQPLLDTMADEFSPAISPDGAWIAYSSRETGRNEVYAQRFPELGNKVAISAAVGRHPLWAPDGNALFYSTPGGLMKVSVERGSSLQVGSTELLVPERQRFFR